MSKITILTHADCDGICSGSIAQARFPQARVFFTKPVSLLADLQEVDSDSLVICDIALNHRDAPGLLREFGRRGGISYFDHHPLPGNVTEKGLQSSVTECVHKEGFSASELVYRTYQSSLPGEMVWSALYGAIGDYSENTDFVLKRMLDWDKISMYFQVSTLVMGIKMDAFDSYDAKRLIVRTLASGGKPTDVPRLLAAAGDAVRREFELYDVVKRMAKKSGSIGYVKEVQGFGFRGSSALFAATAADAPIGICVDIKDHKIDVTIRARNPKYKLNRLAEQAAESVNGSGGGLPAAAGARIPKGTLDKFIKKMNALLL